MNGRTTIGIGKQGVEFYLWVGLGYFFVGLFNTLAKYPDNIIAGVANSLWGVVYVILLNFILFEYTIPFIRRKRENILHNFLWGILLVFIHLILYSFASYLWKLLGIQLHIYTTLKIYPKVELEVANQMAYSAGSFFLFGIVRHIYNYIKLKQATQQLRIEKQAAELNYLRSQTNPHFLFNTLNNIYSLARDKSELAPESILRLSKILRFMLYETGGDYIAIEQEMKVINDYIALEKLRYDDSLLVNFNHDVEDMKQALPPLLLIPLVENAFKHGVSETRHHPFVDIHLSLRNRQLTFIVKNSAEAFSGGESIKENIGLANLRRQLELLYKDHELYVQQGESVFTATLKINLANHV